MSGAAFEANYTVTKNDKILDSFLLPFLLCDKTINRTFAIEYFKGVRNATGCKRATDYAYQNNKKPKVVDKKDDGEDQVAIEVLATFARRK